MGSPTEMDLGGLTLVTKNIKIGATAPGQAGTDISTTELGFIDGVTAGTATASKAVVLGASKDIATITSATITTLTAPTIAGATTMSGAVTFSTTPILGAGTTVDLDSNTLTGSSHAATATKYAFQYTTESLTTAAGASQNEVVTFTSNFAATDLAFVTAAGGTNTQGTPLLKAVMTSNTLTITIKNHHASEALNGTLIFNVWVVKA